MTMRLAFLTLILIVVTEVALRAQTEITSKEDALLISFSRADTPDELISRIRALTPTEKANLIAAVRENRSGRWGGDFDSIYLYILFLLGDPIERKREVTKFRDSPWRDGTLAKLGEPWVIEEVAPDMFREEVIPLFGEIPNLPLSYGAAALIIANLQRATIYPEEVLQWAKKTSPYDQPAILGVMRDWWRENEQFFNEKKYHLVKPGRTRPPLHPPNPEPPTNNASVQVDTSGPSLTTSSLPAPSTPVPPLAEGSAPVVERKSPVWPWVVGIAALIAIAFFVRKRRA